MNRGILYNNFMKINGVIAACLSILLLISSLSAVPLQSTDGMFFKDSGFWVRGEFLTYYKAAPDPVRQFGNPISDAMPDPIRPGIQVQYFDRARMDYDPTKPAGQRVSLAKLGQILRNESKPGDALDFSSNTTMCRTFANSHHVCFAFLQFYDRYKGAAYFGQPISETEILDGMLVQYFEKARLEWRPDLPAGERVVLTALGQLDYDIHIGGANAPWKTPTVLSAQVFIARPVVASGQEQTVYVVVQDQKMNPVTGVSVLITATYPDGRAENFRPDQLTTQDGFTKITFAVKNVQPNQVVRINVTASQPGGEETQAETWFRIWW